MKIRIELTSIASSAAVPSFARRFWPVWFAGLFGVLSLATMPPPAALLEAQPQLRELHPAALKALTLVNPLMLMTGLALIGAAVAHRAGLYSLLAGTAKPPDSWWAWTRWPVIAGLAVSALLVALDVVFAPRLGPDWAAVRSRADLSPLLPDLLRGVLYGGLSEEVMLRWGAMALLAWALFALGRFRGGAGRLDPAGPTRQALMTWAAIWVSALLFAVAHLPALAASVELSANVVARTLTLNTIAGLAYGWLFSRQGLESAMVAHASTHLGFALARALSV